MSIVNCYKQSSDADIISKYVSTETRKVAAKWEIIYMTDINEMRLPFCSLIKEKLDKVISTIDLPLLFPNLQFHQPLNFPASTPSGIDRNVSFVVMFRNIVALINEWHFWGKQTAFTASTGSKKVIEYSKFSVLHPSTRRWLFIFHVKHTSAGVFNLPENRKNSFKVWFFHYLPFFIIRIYASNK